MNTRYIYRVHNGKLFRAEVMRVIDRGFEIKPSVEWSDPWCCWASDKDPKIGDSPEEAIANYKRVTQHEIAILEEAVKALSESCTAEPVKVWAE